jgi:hypothetical protein
MGFFISIFYIYIKFIQKFNKLQRHMFHVNSGEAEAGKHSWERNHSMEGKKERNNKPPKKLYVPQFLSSFQKNGIYWK